MNRLAVDTSTDQLSIAAARADGRVAERSATGARRHAGLLVGLVAEALGELGLGLEDVDRILLADGPGSFTGLRVGAAWVKGVSLRRRTPVATASTLLVRAARARPTGPGRPRAVLGIGSALRGEAFVAGYRLSADRVETAFPPTVLAPGASLPGGFVPEWVVGDWTADFAAGWGLAAGTVVLGPPEGGPRARELLTLSSMADGTTLVDDLANWEPVYGRPAEAQARWELRHGRRLVDSVGGA